MTDLDVTLYQMFGASAGVYRWLDAAEDLGRDDVLAEMDRLEAEIVDLLRRRRYRNEEQFDRAQRTLGAIETVKHLLILN